MEGSRDLLCVKETRLMRRPAHLIVSVFLVFFISGIEWDTWFRDLDKTRKAESLSEERIPLKTICISEKAQESHELPLRSEAAVVLDTRKGEVLYRKNIDTQLPIASLTKLMSALVFLETKPDLDDRVTITAADINCPGKSEIKVGETVTLRDLLHASLMSSSNQATKALARACPVPASEFVARMNGKARELGLQNVLFCEPTGLDERNRSTALDCARLLYFALQDSVVGSIFDKTTYQFASLDKEKRRHTIGCTNKLLFSSLKVKGGKTGYNGASGWCLGTLVEGGDGREVAAVVLGAPSKQDRFKEIRSIVEWSIETKRTGG
jgi:D-alanyl-D-alanine endopeptidase (penicillin-binding protein 7)